MTPRSLTTRVLRGTVFVALATALAGAATATLIARSLWLAHERRGLQVLAAGLAQAIERETAEDPARGPDTAASEALRESVPAGHRAEVWRGALLVATSDRGSPLGPPGGSARSRRGWMIETRVLASGMTLIVGAPRERSAEVLRVFGWSLVLSAPVCVVLALLIGRVVGRRAARPLLDLRDRIAAARPFDRLPAAPPPDVREVGEIEASFGALWDRLKDAMTREAEFAANAAHELRTPLTRIRLHAERARAAGAAPPEMDGLVEEIDRVTRLVDSLLVLARDAASGIPDGEAVNIVDLAADGARRAFAGGPAPRVEAPDEALVRGDEALLGIAVLNLLDNARKFSSPDRRASVRVSGDEGGVRLTITTPGARIASEERERLFERFYRGPEPRAALDGHGLGLPLARHIARLHGGDVRCVSGPDDDARFELSLPAWRPRPAEGATRPGGPR